MDDVRILTCENCPYAGPVDSSDDGFFYCPDCDFQFDGVFDSADDDVYILKFRRKIKAEQNSQPCSVYDAWSNFVKNPGLGKEQNIDEASASRPKAFGRSKHETLKDYHNQITTRYVMGLQMMIELQCESLVKEFKVTPLVCGLVGTIWLRFISMTGVFDDDQAYEVMYDSEMQKEGEPEDYNLCAKYRAEPRNMFGQRFVIIWFRYLKKKIPLACTVAVSYLACHIAREAILPSDMMKWTLEGKLPYFSAFVELERRMGHPSLACPISSSAMFKPRRAIPVQKLESFAASIAHCIGLELPPVNFHAIAYRYLKKLSLPVEKILPYACHIYEWSLPPDSWLSLSKEYFKLPTHVCVVSILVIAIRILYNINGYGEWEQSLSRNVGAKDNGEIDTNFASHDGHSFGKDSVKDPVECQKHKIGSVVLLQHLHAIYNEIADFHEYSKDLPTYLKYCRDVVFDGSKEPSDDNYEERLIEHLWNFYENEENTTKPSEHAGKSNTSFNQSRLTDEGRIRRTSKMKKVRRECFKEPSLDDGTFPVDDLPGSLSNDNSSETSSNGEDSVSNKNSGSGKSVVNEAITQMKLEMEENLFCYIPPSVKPRKLDYVHYVRKKDKGALTYVTHADYYILLRACARIAQVDIRILHIGVLRLEKRLAWLEKQIDQCLHLKLLNISCQFCSVRANENGSDDVHRYQ